MTVQVTAREPKAPEAKPSLVERARKLAPAIAERARWVEENREVHPDSMAEMAEAGLTTALQSSMYGGEEANPAEFYQMVVELSKACTSTGWLCGILGVHSWEMAHLGREVNDEMFADDPHTLMSSSYNHQGNKAEKVPGGYRLSGWWKSSTGVTHSKWVVVGAKVEGEKSVFNFCVPLSDAGVRVDDDWFVLGLRGTASRSVILDNVFVPEHRASDRDIIRGQFGPGLRWNKAPLYRVPQAYIYTCVSSAPAIGTGLHYFEVWKKHYGFASTVDRTIENDRLIMNRMAKAKADLSAFELLAVTRLQQAYDVASAGGQLSNLEIALGMYDISRPGSVVLDMANSLQPSLRPSSIYEKYDVERLYRDIVVARQHGTANLDERADVIAAYELEFEQGINLFMSPEDREAARQRAKAKGYID